MRHAVLLEGHGEVKRNFHRVVDTEEVDVVRRHFIAGDEGVEVECAMFQRCEVREVNDVRLSEKQNHVLRDSVR